MRTLILMFIFLGQNLSFGQSDHTNLDKKLDKFLLELDAFYQASLPYKQILDMRSAQYNDEGQLIPASNLEQRYKLVNGDGYSYFYTSTTQLFKDTLGELLIDNQKKLIEFNSIRPWEDLSPSFAIRLAVEETGSVLITMNTKSNQTILMFKNEKAHTSMEYLFEDYLLTKVIHRTHKDSGELVSSLTTSYSGFEAKLKKPEKYQIASHGKVKNDEFIPLALYADYTLFNY